MRQLCPYCAKLVDLPESAAGRETPCPACGKAFAVPAAYAPSVSESAAAPTAPPRPTPPPGLVTPAVVFESAVVYETDATERGVTLNPALVAWLPAILLTLALVLSLFFSAVGAFPGGLRILSQSPVEALVASVSSISVATLQDAEKAIKDAVRSNWLMLFYFGALFAATALAWFMRLFRNPTLQTVPAMLLGVLKLWPRRHFLLLLLSSAAFALLLVQTWRGFGLENAVKDTVNAKYAKQVEAADTTFSKQELQVKIGQEIGGFNLTHTTALDVSLLALLGATGFVLLDGWLSRRGPAPVRLLVRY
jgi:hypothetical protein